ncbi:efflux transporter outer membrane subunit [Pelagicoccus sp. SDUM812003]|uniref:efflux transporter outer membrane subunit n=1 Tax=Pelagicoccus sp. SDUM812003 TaxID=3041267 RepID=UPI00280F4A60|nr:efflux transporter outer membrane subunit [Pelagicoccus sp. SDUM812003]MDQ8204621.1 efflux transporter outer membrane subunit [Pelagicoccus sp. SDUM812003]
MGHGKEKGVGDRLSGCFFAAALCIWLAGCASVDTGSLDDAVTKAAPFSRSGEVSLEERWWQAFEDEQLDRLVETGLSENISLEAAWNRLEAARAVARRSQADLYPRLDAVASASRNRPEDRTSGDRFSAGLAADYEVDLWGRVRASARASDFEAAATREDYRAAALTLSAEITRNWFAWITAQAQHDLLEDQLTANEQVLQLIENRFSSGQLRSVDVLRQRQLVEATREQVYVSEARIQVLEHLLQTLLGRAPQEDFSYAEGMLPNLPPLPETGLPSDLLQRRPDLRGAAFALEAASADAARAARDRLPRLSLGGELLSEGDEIENVFDDWIRRIAADVIAPVFAGGALSAEAERTRAVTEQRLAEYGQAALDAFREVEDALARERGQEKRLQSLQEQERLADRSYEQLRVEYFNGVGNYIDVLTAQTDLQQLRRDLLEGRFQLYEYRIALYRALAGGFETPREEEDES